MANVTITEEDQVTEEDMLCALMRLEIRVSELAAKVKKLEHLVSILSPSIIERQKWD